MCEEMEEKFSQLSELLVVNLQLRDKLVTELSVKNKFICAMLRVQSLKQSSMDIGSRPRSHSVRTDERINGKVKTKTHIFANP